MSIGPFSRDCGHLSLFGSFSCGLELPLLFVLQLWLTLLIILKFTYLFSFMPPGIALSVGEFTSLLANYGVYVPHLMNCVYTDPKSTSLWTGYSHHWHQGHGLIYSLAIATRNNYFLIHLLTRFRHLNK